jgi:hypothetical protein
MPQSTICFEQQARRSQFPASSAPFAVSSFKHSVGRFQLNGHQLNGYKRWQFPLTPSPSPDTAETLQPAP